MTGTPLSGVRVEAAGRNLSTVTNSSGDYALPVADSGHQALRFSRPLYDSITIEITIPVGHSLRLDVDLLPRPVELPSIVVMGMPSGHESPPFERDPAEPTAIGFRRFSERTMRHDPMSLDRDPLLTIAASPAAGGQSSYPTSLHIRGGSGDQNLILLDGVPVYGAMHLGGVAGIFNPDAIGSVELHSAVPPASLSGRLSSVIDVQLRSTPATSPTLRGAWTPMSVRQMFETSLDRGRGSVLLSGRRSYRGIFAADPGEGQKANRFEDYLFRGSHASGREDVTVYLVQSSDQLGFAAVAQPGNSQGENADSTFNQFHWSTNSQALVWRHAGSADRRVTGRVWHAGAGAEVGWSADTAARRLTSALNETGVRFEFLQAGAHGHRLAGVELRHLDTRYDVAAPVSRVDTGLTFQPVHLQAGPLIVGAFMEGGRSIGAHWSVLAGLRANYLTRFGVQLEPRLSTRYRLTPGVSLSLGYARLYQYVHSMRNEESLIDRLFGADLPVAVGSAGIGPARSDQVSAALEARLGPQSALRIDSYVRSFHDLPAVATVTGAPFADRLVPTGPGHASGVTVEVTHHSSHLDLRGAAGGGRTVRESGATEYSPGTQRAYWAVLGAGYRLNRTTVRFTNSWTAGTPTTPLRGTIDWQPSGAAGVGGEISGSPQTIGGSLNQSRLPAYLRSDLGIEHRWDVPIMGRPGVLTTSLTLSNLFNRRNVLGYLAEPSSVPLRDITYPPRSLGLQVGWEF